MVNRSRDTIRAEFVFFTKNAIFNALDKSLRPRYTTRKLEAKTQQSEIFISKNFQVV